MVGASTVRVRRIYEPVDADDGQRVLVDRIWPRGVSKERARLNHWAKDVAPSTELRKWYGHDPDKYDEFTRRYREELTEPVRAGAFDELRVMAANGKLTLLTASKRADISEATVLADEMNTSGERPKKSS